MHSPVGTWSWYAHDLRDTSVPIHRISRRYPIRRTVVKVGDFTDGARRRLSREAVLDAALELVDAEGLDALSIRRLARGLGVTPMALYWHFRDKEELVDGVVDRILGEVDLTDAPSAPWQERIAAVLRSYLAVLRAHHASCAQLLGAGRTPGRHGLAALERGLGILDDAGLAPEEATQLLRHLVHGAIALVAAPTVGLALADPQRQREGEAWLSSLPRERFPHVVEAAGPLSRCDDVDRYYEQGMTFLLAGAQAMVELAGARSLESQT